MIVELTRFRVKPGKSHVVDEAVTTTNLVIRYAHKD